MSHVEFLGNKNLGDKETCEKSVKGAYIAGRWGREQQWLLHFNCHRQQTVQCIIIVLISLPQNIVISIIFYCFSLIFIFSLSVLCTKSLIEAHPRKCMQHNICISKQNVICPSLYHERVHKVEIRLHTFLVVSVPLCALPTFFNWGIP